MKYHTTSSYIKFTNEILYFIETALKIRNKKQLIVYSHNSIPQGFIYDSEMNEIIYKNERIKVLNTSEAISNFETNTKITNINSLNYKTMTMQQENKGNVIVGENGSATDIQTGDNNKNLKKIQKESVLIGLILGIIASLVASWIWSKI